MMQKKYAYHVELPSIMTATFVVLICLSIDAVSQVKTGQHRSQQTATQSTDQLSQIRAALSSLNEKIEKLEEKLSIQEFLFTEKLESGAWNPAELILTPATPDQLGYLAISINTNTVSLHTR